MGVRNRQKNKEKFDRKNGKSIRIQKSFWKFFNKIIRLKSQIIFNLIKNNFSLIKYKILLNLIGF